MRRGWLRRLERQSVVLHTKDDRSLRGVLKAVHADCVVVVEPEWLDDEDSTSLQGSVVVPRANVSFFQVAEG